MFSDSGMNDSQGNVSLKEEDSMGRRQVKPGMNVAYAVFAHISLVKATHMANGNGVTMSTPSSLKPWQRWWGRWKGRTVYK